MLTGKGKWKMASLHGVMRVKAEKRAERTRGVEATRRAEAPLSCRRRAVASQLWVAEQRGLTLGGSFRRASSPRIKLSCISPKPALFIIKVVLWPPMPSEPGQRRGTLFIAASCAFSNKHPILGYPFVYSPDHL